MKIEEKRTENKQKIGIDNNCNYDLVGKMLNNMMNQAIDSKLVLNCVLVFLPIIIRISYEY